MEPLGGGTWDMGTMGMGGGCRGCSGAPAAARSPLWGGWGLANGGTPAPSKAGTQGGCRTGRGQRCCGRAVRDAWLQQVPGSQRGWAARERCQPSALCLPSPGSALPPSSQPLRASPPLPAPGRAPAGVSSRLEPGSQLLSHPRHPLRRPPAPAVPARSPPRDSAGGRRRQQRVIYPPPPQGPAETEPLGTGTQVGSSGRSSQQLPGVWG